MNKTLIAMLLIFTLTNFNVSNFAVSAIDSPVSIKVLCDAYSDSNGVSLTPSRTKLSFPGIGTYAVYNVSIATTGEYELIANVATVLSSKMRIYVDDVQMCESSLILGADYNTYYNNKIGGLLLEQGQHTIKIYSALAGFILQYFMLEKMDDFKINSILTDDIEILNGATIPRGKDNFTIIFSRAIFPNSLNDENIKLTGSNETIPVLITISDNKVMLYLKKTLSDGVTYTITTDKVKDKYGRVEVTNSFSFITGGTDSGTASLSDITSTITYENVALSGKVLSSKGIGIEGRTVNVFLEDTIGNVGTEPIISTVAKENGLFDFSYVIPTGSPCGKYTFILGGDYITAPQRIPLNYVSKEKENEILSQFKVAIDADTVKNIFETYQDTFGVNLNQDMGSVPDRSKVFNYFIELDIPDVDNFRKKYFSFIALETINQATSDGVVKNVLNDADSCNYLGIDKNKIDLIENNWDNFITDVLNMSEISNVDLFLNAFDVVSDKWLATEKGKIDLISSATSKDVYIGQGVDVKIGFTTIVNHIKSVKYIIKSNDAELLSNAIAELKVDAVLNVEISGTTAEIVITPNRVLSSVDYLGDVILTAPNKVCDFTIEVSGIVEYDVGIPFTIKTNIIPKSITINIKKNPNSLSGEKSVAMSPGTKSVISNKNEEGENLVPVDPQKTDNNYSFKDLDTVEWAKESIDQLLKRGIVSKSEDNKFNPNQDITRAEFIKMVVECMGVNEKNLKTTFNDVDVTAWYYDYVANAENHKLVTGDDKGNFNADDKITRQEMAVIIFRGLSSKGIDMDSDNQQFDDDSSISPYAKEAIYAMKKLSFINGMGDNLFMPERYATRAMAAKIINEMIKVVGS